MFNQLGHGVLGDLDIALARLVVEGQCCWRDADCVVELCEYVRVRSPMCHVGIEKMAQLRTKRRELAVAIFQQLGAIRYQILFDEPVGGGDGAIEKLDAVVAGN